MEHFKTKSLTSGCFGRGKKSYTIAIPVEERPALLDKTSCKRASFCLQIVAWTCMCVTCISQKIPVEERPVLLDKTSCKRASFCLHIVAWTCMCVTCISPKILERFLTPDHFHPADRTCLEKALVAFFSFWFFCMKCMHAYNTYFTTCFSVPLIVDLALVLALPTWTNGVNNTMWVILVLLCSYDAEKNWAGGWIKGSTQSWRRE